MRMPAAARAHVRFDRPESVYVERRHERFIELYVERRHGPCISDGASVDEQILVCG